jgi:hypothetical protein
MHEFQDIIISLFISLTSASNTLINIFQKFNMIDHIHIISYFQWFDIYFNLLVIT